MLEITSTRRTVSNIRSDGKTIDGRGVRGSLADLAADYMDQKALHVVPVARGSTVQPQAELRGNSTGSAGRRGRRRAKYAVRGRKCYSDDSIPRHMISLKHSRALYVRKSQSV